MGGDDCTANESRRPCNAGCQGAGERGAKSMSAPLKAVGLCPNDNFLFKKSTILCEACVKMDTYLACSSAASLRAVASCLSAVRTPSMRSACSCPAFLLPSSSFSLSAQPCVSDHSTMQYQSKAVQSVKYPSTNQQNAVSSCHCTNQD